VTRGITIEEIVGGILALIVLLNWYSGPKTVESGVGAISAIATPWWAPIVQTLTSLSPWIAVIFLLIIFYQFKK